MRLIPVFILALLLVGTTASAQRPAPGSDTVLKGSTIEVIQSYKPRVKQLPKPDWKPQLPPVDTSRPSFSFDVPQQTLYYTYNSTPLRPLALGKIPNELPYPNYVKLGGGNRSTIYLDAGIGSIKGENYETALHLHSITQKGSIENQQSSLSGLEAEGTLHNATGDWHATLEGAHNRYAYYGYDHLLYNYTLADVQQAYTSVKVGSDMKNREDTNTALYYHPSLTASYYKAKYNTSEVTFGFNAPISFKLSDAFSLHLGVSGAITNFRAFTNISPTPIITNNNYVLALPGVLVHTKNFSGRLLAGVAYGKGGSTYFLPDVLASFALPLIDMKASFGWKADLRQNTYEQLTTENPYLLNTYQTIQTKRDEIFADVQGTAGNHIAYSGRVSWWNYFDLPTFLNDTGDQKAFYIQYQNVQAISFQASVRYHVAKQWSAGVTADIYNFYKHTDQANTPTSYVWHAPGTRIRGDVTAKITPKLDIATYVTVLGGIHAKDPTLGAITLKTLADLSINAEYSFIPRLSAFVQLNNVLGGKYQRWYGYPVYGFNVYGGLRLKF